MRKLIIALSVAVPVVVAALFRVKIEGVDLHFLPPIYAGINAITAFVLILALIAIKQKKTSLHRRLIRLALLMSVLFLLAYVAYHSTAEETKYCGELGVIYYPLLISHILLSIAVIPVVLFTYLHAWEGNFEKHRKWTRFAFPLWLYVAVSGVIVYLMISPFYTNK